ncbi:MAG: GH3 auxin-responsive promoter family protein [Bacteroidota bacterium]
MGIKSFLAKQIANWRVKQIRKTVADPRKAQEQTLRKLLDKAKDTAFGRDHDFGNIQTLKDFQERVPVNDYEGIRPYIDRAYAGEKDVLWPGQPAYFAKTSGTTSGAKYIPLTDDSMKNQVKGARDALLFYINETGNASFINGKMIFLTGAPTLEKNEAGLNVGRLSGISMHYVPNYLQRNRVPSWETNCIEDWEKKIEKIVEETKDVDLRVISGIPPWVQMYVERLQEVTSKSVQQIWPNLQLFVQGGVDYRPYEDMFRKYLGDVDVVEVYPASEGFIGVQSSLKDNGLMLMLDYDIFYEFIPLEEYGKENARRLPLWEVEKDTDYAIVLSTNAGLWAYDIGDTVRFTSLEPYKLRVSGRVKHFISAFGEHVIQQEVNSAMVEACDATRAEVTEFTVAPFVSEHVSYHEWFVEFETPPSDLKHFSELIDQAMQRQNSYYADLREGNMLRPAVVHMVERDACREYMKSIGKLGGQNKYPRLGNDRKVASFMEKYVIA